MAWERVYTINDFRDGPRLGVADVEGAPHVYQSLFDSELDDYAAYCLVAPSSCDLLELVLEDWGIWVRWDEAFQRGKASKASHPALPNERERHEEIKRLIGDRLFVHPDSGRKLIAEFRSIRAGWDGFEVQ